MGLDFVAVVPYIAPLDNIRNFLEGVERDELHRFIFLDNSPGSDLRAFGLEQHGARVEYHPENLGVGASWNRALREGREQTLILSASMRWPEGFRAFLPCLERGVNQWGGLTRLGWHCISLGARTVEALGLIDENFYPAYYEDTDYACRMRIGNIHDGGEMSSNLPVIAAPIERAGIALALKSGAYRSEFGKLAEYYARKWGGNRPDETFTTPFGEDRPLSYWPGATTDELRARYGL